MLQMFDGNANGIPVSLSFTHANIDERDAAYDSTNSSEAACL